MDWDPAHGDTSTAAIEWVEAGSPRGPGRPGRRHAGRWTGGASRRQAQDRPTAPDSLRVL